MQLTLSGFDKIRQKKALSSLAKKACDKIPGLKKPGEINFILVSDAQLKKLHKDFLNDAGLTDVITFQYDEERPSKRNPEPPLGDVYISKDAARKAAQKGGYETFQEIAFLMVHGLLHLTGWDDHSPAARRKMLERQRQVILAVSPSLCPPR